jgi:hypothetical protein
VVGGSITALGPYVPFTWVGSAIFVVGSGMIYTLKVNSSAGMWIGYQILAGAGAGACVQIPFIAVQVVLNKKDMPSGNAVAIFFNSLGGAFSISTEYFFEHPHQTDPTVRQKCRPGDHHRCWSHKHPICHFISRIAWRS